MPPLPPRRHASQGPTQPARRIEGSSALPAAEGSPLVGDLVFVGVLRLLLSFPGARSLKDRRRAVLSFKDRVASRYRVSVAEVGALDDPRYATLGVAVVANEAGHCDAVLEEVAGLASRLPDAVLQDRATEIVPFGSGGRGVSGGIEQLALGSAARHDDDDGGER